MKALFLEFIAFQGDAEDLPESSNTKFEENSWGENVGILWVFPQFSTFMKRPYYLNFTEFAGNS